MFLAYDGDKVGRKLENLLIENDEQLIEVFAKEVLKALCKLENSLLNEGCKVIFASGDSVLAKSNTQFYFEKIDRQYGGITFSLGVGETPLEAMLALKKAKSNGSGEYCQFSLQGYEL